MRQFVRSPVFAFVALALAFELPMLFAQEALRPSGDPLALATLWIAAAQLRVRRALRGLLVAAGVLLWLHRIDHVAFQQFMGDEPLLYDQFFLLRHLFVLIGDVWSGAVAAQLAIVIAAGALSAFIARRLLARLELPQAPRERRAMYFAALGLWPALLFGSAAAASAGHAETDAVTETAAVPAVRWQAAAFSHDVVRSARIYAAVQERLGASPYRHYAGIVLGRKPDVYLLLVESYGRVIAEHPSMRRRWKKQLSAMQKQLRAVGWHAASAFSKAPVMGGRSWLAEATLLTGTRVQYQAVFHQLIAGIARVPHLPGFLKQQGYHTVLLAPADRERPGVKNVNYYGYDRAVRFDDLHYGGPKIGWGLVPDQYSLWHTQERVLQRAARPLFFNFHMVSSHAPFEDVPELVADWRTLDEGSGEARAEAYKGTPTTALKRFLRGTRRFAGMGELHYKLGQLYVDAIHYELAVVERYLAQLPGDALVIVMGDHQPPFVAAQTRSYDAPVHVFARDPKLLEELRRSGFRRGLVLGKAEGTATTHAGLFSLLVRTLARCCSSGEPPVYLPEGVALGS